MPDPRPHPNLTLTPENMRTGVIVSVVISVVAVSILVYVAVTQVLKRGVKAGTWRAERRREDVGLEVGVVREVLPAYCREVRAGEKVLISAGGER
jgi:hypothetical protein